MGICLKCGKTTIQPGTLCACGKAYTVRENHGKDPLSVLGKFLANKFIPIAVTAVKHHTVCYEAIQPAVDRTVSLTVIRPECAKNEAMMTAFRKTIDAFVSIKQQNLPTILEAIELKAERTRAIICDAAKGELLTNFVKSGSVEPVTQMHIVHQLLQAIAALHQNHILFPGFCMENVHILRSGGDDAFVKISGILEANLAALNKHPSPQKDIYDITQLILSLITNQLPPITSIDLPPDRAFLMPIAQLFLAAATNPQAFNSCADLLTTFESALNLGHVRDTNQTPLSSQENPAVDAVKSHTVPLEQILWMHQPPQYEA